jgi:pilus assembly protein CpaB
VKKVKILALLSAIVTALLLFVFLSSLVKFGSGDKIDVVTAAQDIPANTLITEEMLVMQELPEDAVLTGAITKMSDVVGKTIQANVYAGEQIISAKLIAPGEAGSGTLAYSIEPGMRAITIAVDATTGLSGMIKPGNHVDLVGEYAATGGTVTDIIAQNIKILAVDNVLEQAGTSGEAGAPAYSTITMEVTPTQAMEISLAVYSGTLRAVLRSPLDEAPVNIKAITLAKVLNL